MRYAPSRGRLLILKFVIESSESPRCWTLKAEVRRTILLRLPPLNSGGETEMVLSDWIGIAAFAMGYLTVAFLSIEVLHLPTRLAIPVWMLGGAAPGAVAKYIVGG